MQAEESGPDNMPERPEASRDAPEGACSADGLLVARLRKGDVDAGYHFFREYYPSVYRYLFWLTECSQQAEDLAQETLVRAWRHLDRFDPRGSLRAWLHRIAHREFLRSVRRETPTSLWDVEELAAPEATAFTEAIALRQILRKLPSQQREAVLLHDLEGYSSSEIALIVGAPASTVRRRLAQAREQLRQELGEDDLTYLNAPLAAMQPWHWLPLEQLYTLEARLTTSGAAEEDTMERREFLRQAAVGAAGLVLPDTEKEVVDSRLTQKATCTFKATALSDLCERLRADTGVQLVAGNSVADEKVTVFCERLPLREVMRQLSRSFGYTWLRSGTPGQYRYELVQDLKSQLLEEELRSRDRNQALLALDQEIEKYRPYLHLLPNEALERLKTARPEEKKLLEEIANNPGVWGPLQMYYRLSPSEMAALRAGQRLFYREEPGPGDRPLPPDLKQGIFQTWRWVRLVRREDGFSAAGESDPNGCPLSAIPEARACFSLEMKQSELGQIALNGASGYYTPLTPSTPRQSTSLDGRGPIAVGRSPIALKPDNAAVNARLAHDPSLRLVVTVQPQPSCRPDPASPSLARPASAGEPGAASEPKVTSADILEAVHQATGMPIVSDFHTRLYPVGTMSVLNRPLFDALNQLADAMRMRWNKEGGAEPTRSAGARPWLRFRSTAFYDDRRKEIPNRLLARWHNSRRRHGTLTLEDLIEIAQLPEEQLKATDMAAGVKECWELAEWEIMRNPVRHPYWRHLAEFTPDQRRKMTCVDGLPFTEMTLAQQQRFMAIGLEWDNEPLQSLDELAGAALRVNYTVPGAFEWQIPGPDWLRYVVPVVQGREGRRALCPLVVEQTRDAALQTARRLFPTLREPLLQAIRRADPTFDEAQLEPCESQIVPTKLLLEMIHLPGSANKHQLHVVRSDWMGWYDTW
jgi:RNA polymerase sigma-70 factor (ECF subfamily)